MSQIEKKTVLITGGAQGLGRLLAEQCIAHGAAKVILWDINEEGLAETAGELAGRGSEVEGYAVDVQDSDQIAATAEAILEEQPVHILVNNAGIVVGKPLAEHSHADIDRTINVNVLGVMHCTRAFLPAMLEQGGHIVNLASASGYMALPRLTTYAASKWACLGFSESLRVELEGQSNIHITTVCPTYIDTGMFDGVKAPAGVPLLKPDYVVERIVKAILRDTPILRLPWLVNTIPITQALLPRRLFELFIGKGLGIYKAMDHFEGHGRR